MRFVLDTNVLVSGLFFRGKPGQIVDWWLASDSDLLVTEEVLTEYGDVLARLALRYPALHAKRLFQMIVLKALLVKAKNVPSDACQDANDLKFLACAIGGSSEWVVSGDKHLLSVHGWRGLRIVSPATFVAMVIAGQK